MGIEIYLNGYDEYNERCAEERAAFNQAVKARDRCQRGNAGATDAQKKVDKAADAMWSGRVGYLWSSYNGSGLFRVLEEIFGFDMASYFFPGDWEEDQDIDGAEFVDKVQALQATATLAMTRGVLSLPWINEYSEVTGQKAPDTHAGRAGGEAFGDLVRNMIAGMVGGEDKLEPTDRPVHATLSQDHAWYLTGGLKDLREFGELAKRLKAEGKRTYAHISY